MKAIEEIENEIKIISNSSLFKLLPDGKLITIPRLIQDIVKQHLAKEEESTSEEEEEEEEEKEKEKEKEKEVIEILLKHNN